MTCTCRVLFVLGVQVGDGPSPALMEQIEAILKAPQTSVRGQSPQLSAAVTRADLEKRLAATPDDWNSRLALARIFDDEGQAASAVSQLEAATKLRPRDSSIAFAWGLVLLHHGEKDAALVKWKQARDLDPENWRIRKQIWAIEHPEKFYTRDSPDFGWQNEELGAGERR